MTSLVQEFLEGDAIAYPCGNPTLARKLLKENPLFDGVKVAPSSRTMRSRLSKGTEIPPKRTSQYTK